MTTRTKERDEVTRQTDRDPPVIHLYPNPPGAHVGAKAYCGHVKVEPFDPVWLNYRVTCAVCAEWAC